MRESSEIRYEGFMGVLRALLPLIALATIAWLPLFAAFRMQFGHRNPVNLSPEFPLMPFDGIHSIELPLIWSFLAAIALISGFLLAFKKKAISAFER